jgi:alpha,alpha-trehalase
MRRQAPLPSVRQSVGRSVGRRVGFGRRFTSVAAVLAALLFAGALAPAREARDAGAIPAAHVATAKDLEALRAYVRVAWSTLTRSARDLPKAAVDPKFPPPAGGRAPVYVARDEDLDAIRRHLAEVLPPAELALIELRRLPPGEREPAEPGLLYLPHAYVVPGGRFNEMYGWDSYFIVRGLLADGEVTRARDMVDDSIYEVQRFGKVLNANRTYYLGRSQPPLLTAMIRAVYGVTHDRAWLASTLPAIRAQHRYWESAPHRAGTTGLSRYHAGGQGPAPEVVASERDAQGRTHYDRVRAALAAEPPSPTIDRFYDRRRDRLTPLAYVADRTVRESGFDPSDRFGRFGLQILDFAPVCLNSLLYGMERDTAAILDELGEPREARRWSAAAERRGRLVRDLLWDEGHGLFFDYDFAHGQRRVYPFATTFFPLWVGLATPAQAQRIVETAVPLLMRAGGLSTSTNRSGSQWDEPFGWAPLHLLAAEGLQRYGFASEAKRVALPFLGTVLGQFVVHGTIFEKYDVVRRAADVAPDLRFGYESNQIGFGWTNGVFRALEGDLGAGTDVAIVRAAAP